ncbi:zinc-dependent alcohol dehydrogenase [Vibrio rhodolitus]|uniref:zinc-dependent alcohol dehydrogenase n=1 Tax=Vibrio rhodolitus TaxID=2231649 RepID=UPI000E0AF1F8|nr:alcohol dehydrogenase catalytic domain-containing protein [Vibrio rhodolitus]
MTVLKQVKFDKINSVITEMLPLEVRELQPHEVRVATKFMGVCGSEIHVLHDGHPFAKPPMVPGHEVCVEVLEVGSAVTGIQVGDPAVLDPIMACMECPACKREQYNLCEPPQVAGFRAPGFGKSELVVPAHNVHVASKSIPMEQLALAEVIACGTHCVDRVPQENRGKVLIIGAGTIGLSVIQAAFIKNFKEIHVIEPDPGKRKLAEKYGAYATYAIGELPEDERFDAVIDVVSTQATLAQSLVQVRAGGTVVIMGVPSKPVELNLGPVQRFERDIRSSGMYVSKDWDVAVEWLKQGLFKTEDMITDVFAVEDADKAYQRAQEADSIKVLIKF